MVVVRFVDQGLRERCAGFLRFTFPGNVSITEGDIVLTFPPNIILTTGSQRAVVERLLWAWKSAEHIDTDDGVVVPRLERDTTP